MFPSGPGRLSFGCPRRPGPALGAHGWQPGPHGGRSVFGKTGQARNKRETGESKQATSPRPRPTRRHHSAVCTGAAQPLDPCIHPACLPAASSQHPLHRHNSAAAPLYVARCDRTQSRANAIRRSPNGRRPRFQKQGRTQACPSAGSVRDGAQVARFAGKRERRSPAGVGGVGDRAIGSSASDGKGGGLRVGQGEGRG